MASFKNPGPRVVMECATHFTWKFDRFRPFAQDELVAHGTLPEAVDEFVGSLSGHHRQTFFELMKAYKKSSFGSWYKEAEVWFERLPMQSRIRARRLSADNYEDIGVTTAEFESVDLDVDNEPTGSSELESSIEPDEQIFEMLHEVTGSGTVVDSSDLALGLGDGVSAAVEMMMTNDEALLQFIGIDVPMPIPLP